MKIMNKEIDFDDLFRRILALPPKNEEWVTFCVLKGELLKKGWLKKGWSGKREKVEIIINEDMIILKRVNEIKT